MEPVSLKYIANYFAHFANPNPLRRDGGAHSGGPPPACCTAASPAAIARRASRPSRKRRLRRRNHELNCGRGGKIGKFCKFLQIFGGLVLGCIKTKFCKKTCVWQHFSSSTRFASFCTAAISKFSQKIGLKNQQFSWKFSKHFANVAKFEKNCQISKISAR